MHYVNLGATGLQVSRVCLGMMSYGNNFERPWVLDEDEAEPIVRAAADGGINFFDTADVYSAGASETATGRLSARCSPARRSWSPPRCTARPWPGPNAAGCPASTSWPPSTPPWSASSMDYVDLYQIHRWDYRTPIEETMEALNDVVRAGKARYIGASSMFAWQFAKAQYTASGHGWTRFVSMQNHYNLVYREEEREMIPQCIDKGVGVIPWSPLARGFLTGTRTRDGAKHTVRANTDAFGDMLYTEQADFDVADRVNEIAASRGMPAAQVALAWLLHRPGVTAPIVGATKAATCRTRSPPSNSSSARRRWPGWRSRTCRTTCEATAEPRKVHPHPWEATDERPIRRTPGSRTRLLHHHHHPAQQRRLGAASTVCRLDRSRCARPPRDLPGTVAEQARSAVRGDRSPRRSAAEAHRSGHSVRQRRPNLVDMEVIVPPDFGCPGSAFLSRGGRRLRSRNYSRGERPADF